MRGGGHVLDGEFREGRAVGLAASRVDGRGSSGSVAAAQGVHADDVELVGVDGLAGTEHLLPPAGGRILAAGGGVGGGREAGEQQQYVVLGGVELAPGL